LIDFFTIFLAILLVNFIPFYGGFFTSLATKRIQASYLLSYSVGISLWFFVDLINNAAQLDINKGFSGDIRQLGILLAFVFGLFITLSIGRSNISQQEGEGYTRPLFIVLVAIAFTWIGLHALGEGAGVGALASSTVSESLIEAIGGVNGGISFVLHKFLEGVVIGALYRVYARGYGNSIGNELRWIGLLGVAAVAPALLGGSIAYYLAFEVSYFFALAGGAYIYIALALTQPIFKLSGSSRSYFAKIALLILAGVLSMYFAGLFHSPELDHHAE
jgi:hypothetical protein